MFRDYAHRAEVFRAAVARVVAGGGARREAARRKTRASCAGWRARRRRAEGARRAPRRRRRANRIEAGALRRLASITALAAPDARRRRRRPIRPSEVGVDRVLVGAVLALAAFGVVMVFSSGAVFAAQEVRRRRPTSSSASWSTRVLGLGAMSLATAHRLLGLPPARLPAAGRQHRAAGRRAEDRLARRRRHPLVPPRAAVVPARRAGQARARASTSPTLLARKAEKVRVVLRRLPAAAAGHRPDDGAAAQAARPRHRRDLRRGRARPAVRRRARAPATSSSRCWSPRPPGWKFIVVDAVPHAPHAGVPRPVGVPPRRRLPDHRVADQRRLGRRHRPRPRRRPAEAVLPARGAHRLHPVDRRRGAGPRSACCS